MFQTLAMDSKISSSRFLILLINKQVPSLVFLSTEVLTEQWLGIDFNIFSVVLGETEKGGSQEPLMPLAFKHNVNIRKVINAAQEMISALKQPQKIAITIAPLHTYIYHSKDQSALFKPILKKERTKIATVFFSKKNIGVKNHRYNS